MIFRGGVISQLFGAGCTLPQSFHHQKRHGR